MIELSYDIDKLSREIVEALTQGTRYKEVAPDIFTYTDADELRKRAKPETRGLLKVDEYINGDFHYEIGGVRRILNDKGYTIFYDNESLTKQSLIWNMGNMKYFREGYVARLVRRRTMNLQLHIKKDGNVLFSHNLKGGIKYLSFQNFYTVASSIGQELTLKLFTLKPNQSWINELYKRSSIRTEVRPDIRFALGNNIFRTATCLQDFITNINTRDHSISAEWFDKATISDIMDTLSIRNDPTVYFNNFEEYISFIEAGGSSWNEDKIVIGATQVRSRTGRINASMEESIKDNERRLMRGELVESKHGVMSRQDIFETDMSDDDFRDSDITFDEMSSQNSDEPDEEMI